MPHKWSNVRSFYLKGPETAALPLYQTDELWLDDSKVIADGAEQPAEKANIGKKRKAAGDEEEATEEGAAKDESRPKKKAKKSKSAAPAAAAALPEGNDDKLDKEIATRKATLRKQKAAAKKAVEV